AVVVAAHPCVHRGILAALPEIAQAAVRPRVLVYRLDGPVAARCIRYDGRLLAALLPAPGRESATRPLVAASELAEALVVGTAAAGVRCGLMGPGGRFAPVGRSPERLGLALEHGYWCEPEPARRV